MRVAILSDDYLPDSTLVHAKMLHELALEFISRGLHPVVITPCNDKSAPLLSVDFIDGVEIWRFKAGATRGVGNVLRAINETLLSFSAWRALRVKLKKEKVHGIVNYSPSIFWGPLASWIKRTCSCKSYLVLRDFFPQWIIDEGIIGENSLPAKFFRFFEKLNYRASDCIGVMSEKNQSLFATMHPEFTNLEVLRNWAAPVPVDDGDYGDLFRRQHGLVGKVIFFYGGNMGHAQDMDNLMRLARSMQSYSEAQFLFVGQGDEVPLVKQRIAEWGLGNTLFLPSVSQDEFRCILSTVDVGLFSLSRKHTAYNFPGKLLGYMVESKPILGSVNAGNDLIDVVTAAGASFCHLNGEDDALLQSALQLLETKELRVTLGYNANVLLQKSFSVTSAADKILAQL